MFDEDDVEPYVIKNGKLEENPEWERWREEKNRRVREEWKEVQKQTQEKCAELDRLERSINERIKNLAETYEQIIRERHAEEQSRMRKAM